MAKARILVIDDEKGLRSILSKILTDEGYEVLSAASGEAAVELIKHNPVDLALVDLKMPGMGGIQTIRALKEVDRGIINVIITAYGEMESVDEAAELGVYDYIAKPFDIEYVKALVKHLLVDVKTKALPFAEDLKKTFTGELTQRQATKRKFALLKREAIARSKALKQTVENLDYQIADLYDSFVDSVIYKARMIMNTIYFRVILICVLAGAVFGYFYTAWLRGQLSQPKDMERRQKITIEDLYEKIEKIERRQKVAPEDLYEKLDNIERNLEKR